MYTEIRINIDNAAFHRLEEAPGVELGRILRELAATVQDEDDALDTHTVFPKLKDINGNAVGYCRIKLGNFGADKKQHLTEKG